MTETDKALVSKNAWQSLRQFTDARVGLGRAGVSLPTAELLAFQLAHARARDAVHFPLAVAELVEALGQGRQTSALGPPLTVGSRAENRLMYLQRPDLGRRLAAADRDRLAVANDDGHGDDGHSDGGHSDDGAADLALILVDGLSASAVQQHAAGFVEQFLGDMQADHQHRPWRLAPITIVTQGRVAIGDEIGALLGARMVAVIIGERPGLSSPDSLGIYLTHGPRVGVADAMRNCISNVRPRGLALAEASRRLWYLLREADRLGLSGVDLKDRSEGVQVEDQPSGRLK